MTTPLEELFNRDPLEHTREDLQAVVAYLRSQRANFLEEEAKAANKPPKAPKIAGAPKAPAKPKEIKDIGSISLASLGISPIVKT